MKHEFGIMAIRRLVVRTCLARNTGLNLSVAGVAIFMTPKLIAGLVVNILTGMMKLLGFIR